MSIVEPIKEETNGATNQTLSLNLSNTCTSNNCAVKKAIKIADVQELGDVMINQLTKLFSEKTYKTIH